jgi:hypothetical protein
MGRFRTITLAAAFLIGGCAGAPLPSLPVSGTQARHVAPAKTQSLLYVGDPADGTVEVYAYAQHAHVQTLTGFESPAGLCADANGNVFVTDARARTVVEYAHGGTSPIATLETTIYTPDGCSVNSRTGDLAVAASSSTSGTGGLLVFPKARGNPLAYLDPSLYDDAACGYDAGGNLFVDGESRTGSFALAELRSGEGSLMPVTLDTAISVPIGIQNEGGYLAFGAGGSGARGDQSAILHVIVTGKSARVVQTTHVKGAERAFLIDGSTLVGSDGAGDQVRFFTYPKGGTASTPIHLVRPSGVTVSAAKD